jgi:hypothetical protein
VPNRDNPRHLQAIFYFSSVIQHFLHAVFRRFRNVQAKQIPGFPGFAFFAGVPRIVNFLEHRQFSYHFLTFHLLPGLKSTRRAERRAETI